MFIGREIRIQSQTDLDLNHNSTFLVGLEHIVIMSEFQYSICGICETLKMMPST